MIPEPGAGSLIVDEFGTLYERVGADWHDLGTASQPATPTTWRWAELLKRCGKLEVLYP